MKIVVTLEGTTYEHETRSLLNSDAIQVKRQTGMTVPEWQQGLDDQDPEAIKALVFLLKQKAGENPDWHTLDFDHGDLEFDLPEEDEPAGPKEAEGQASSTTTLTPTETPT